MPATSLLSIACTVFVMAAFGSVVLPNRRTGGRLSFHSPAASRFLGPQVDDHLGPVSLRVYVFRGDACNPSDIDANLVRNRAVVMTGNRACSFTQRFANFASKGAAAVLVKAATGTQPGRYVHFRDGSESGWHRRHPMLFVEVDYARSVVEDAESPAGLTVQITVDNNEWVDAFASWPYQAFVRWIPALVFGVAGVAGVYFLVVHLLLINDRFLAKTVAKRRTWRRRVAFATSALVNGHLVALVLEMVSSFAMAVVMGVTGFYSTSNAPAWVTLFFHMQLSGWAFVATFLSSIFWAQRLEKIIPGRKWCITGMLRGEHPRASAIVCLVIFLLEVAIDVSYITYQSWRSRWSPFMPLPQLAAGIFALVELILGVNFLVGTVRYLYEVSKTTIAQRDTGVHRVLRRVWWCAFLIGLSMMSYVICGIVMVACYRWFWAPTGWTVVWGAGSIARATGGLARVFMFQPRRRGRSAHSQPGYLNSQRRPTSLGAMSAHTTSQA